MGVDLILIRPFTQEDIAPAVALEAAYQRAPWSKSIFADELAAPGRIYLAAGQRDLVGYGGVMVVGEEAHVTNLFVTPDERGRGIGRRIMVALIEGAVDNGARHLTLEVRVGNQAARSLYSSLGLAPVGVRRGYYGKEDALILWVHDINRPEYLERLK